MKKLYHELTNNPVLFAIVIFLAAVILLSLMYYFIVTRPVKKQIKREIKLSGDSDVRVWDSVLSNHINQKQ